MGIEELATVVTGEFGWINFLLIVIIVMLSMIGYSCYRKMKQFEEELNVIKRSIRELKRSR